jgi:hypothetical protein
MASLFWFIKLNVLPTGRSLGHLRTKIPPALIPPPPPNVQYKFYSLINPLQAPMNNLQSWQLRDEIYKKIFSLHKRAGPQNKSE